MLAGAKKITIMIILIKIIIIIINEAGDSFWVQVGKLLSSKSDDLRETFFLFQRISVIIKRFNEIAFRGTFIEESCHDE